MNVSRPAEPMVPERLTETIEQYTPRVPSALYFGVALGAIAMLLWSLMGGYDQVIWILFAGAALSAMAFIGELMVRTRALVSSA